MEPIDGTNPDRLARSVKARELGVGAETFRKWVRQDEADRDKVPGKPTSAQLTELARLKKDNAELRRTNEILRLASSFFAQEADPIRRRP
jgi:transposase